MSRKTVEPFESFNDGAGVGYYMLIHIEMSVDKVVKWFHLVGRYLYRGECVDN